MIFRKIAQSPDLNAKKSLLYEIYGLNLRLKSKKVCCEAAGKSHSPQENHWSVLRTATQKAALSGDKIAISSDLEPLQGFEPRTPSLQKRCSNQLS